MSLGDFSGANCVFLVRPGMPEGCTDSPLRLGLGGESCALCLYTFGTQVKTVLDCHLSSLLDLFVGSPMSGCPQCLSARQLHASTP